MSDFSNVVPSWARLLLALSDGQQQVAIGADRAQVLLQVVGESEIDSVLLDQTHDARLRDAVLERLFDLRLAERLRTFSCQISFQLGRFPRDQRDVLRVIDESLLTQADLRR